VQIGIGSKDDGEISFERPLPAGIEVKGFGDAVCLMEALLSGNIRGAVRGNLPSSSVIGELRGMGIEPRRAAFFGFRDRLRALVPVGIDEGPTPAERAEMALLAADILMALRNENADGDAGPVHDPGGRDDAGSQRVGTFRSIRVGVLAAGRPGDTGRSGTVARSLAAGREITESCMGNGLDAHLYGIEIEKALPASDILVAPDGITGNYIFRILFHFAGVEFLGAVYMGLPFVLVDSSSSRRHYDGPVRLAAKLVSLSGP